MYGDGESGDLLGLGDAVAFDCPESGPLFSVVVVDMDENLQGMPVSRFWKKGSGGEFSETWVGAESRFFSKCGEGASFAKSALSVSFLKIGTSARNPGLLRKLKSVAMSRFWQKRPLGGFAEKRATCAELQFSSKTEKCAQ